MIEQLDETLKKILDDSKAPNELRNADVSFEIPKENFVPGQDTVNLYFYDIHENRQLRDPVPIIQQVGGTYMKRRPPMRVDCSYMITAWSTQSGATATSTEHKILSQTLLWLSQFPKIPAQYLPNDWTDESKVSYQPFPVWMSVAQMNGVKEPGEFWAALGSPPRPFLNLVVTIAMDLQLAEDIGPPVITKVVTIGQRERVTETLKPGTEEEFIQIGGRVVDSAQPAIGIAGSVVTIVELQKTATTDSNGHYTFSNLSRGQLTVKASANGFEANQIGIVIPAPEDQSYDIQLNPSV